MVCVAVSLLLPDRTGPCSGPCIGPEAHAGHLGSQTSVVRRGLLLSVLVGVTAWLGRAVTRGLGRATVVRLLAGHLLIRVRRNGRLELGRGRLTRPVRVVGVENLALAEGVVH